MEVEYKMKINLEYNVVGDGREFLNFWDLSKGNDVVAEIKDGRLFLEGTDEISIREFLRRVKELAIKSQVRNISNLVGRGKSFMILYKN
jgi:hypothetical protein